MEEIENIRYTTTTSPSHGARKRRNRYSDR